MSNLHASTHPLSAYRHDIQFTCTHISIVCLLARHPTHTHLRIHYLLIGMMSNRHVSTYPLSAYWHNVYQEYNLHVIVERHFKILHITTCLLARRRTYLSEDLFYFHTVYTFYISYVLHPGTAIPRMWHTASMLKTAFLCRC